MLCIFTAYSMDGRLRASTLPRFISKHFRRNRRKSEVWMTFSFRIFICRASTSRDVVHENWWWYNMLETLSEHQTFGMIKKRLSFCSQSRFLLIKFHRKRNIGIYVGSWYWELAVLILSVTNLKSGHCLSPDRFFLFSSPNKWKFMLNVFDLYRSFGVAFKWVLKRESNATKKERKWNSSSVVNLLLDQRQWKQIELKTISQKMSPAIVYLCVCCSRIVLQIVEFVFFQGESRLFNRHLEISSERNNRIISLELFLIEKICSTIFVLLSAHIIYIP